MKGNNTSKERSSHPHSSVTDSTGSATGGMQSTL